MARPSRRSPEATADGSEFKSSPAEGTCARTALSMVHLERNHMAGFGQGVLAMWRSLPFPDPSSRLRPILGGRGHSLPASLNAF